MPNSNSRSKSFRKKFLNRKKPTHKWSAKCTNQSSRLNCGLNLTNRNLNWALKSKTLPRYSLSTTCKNWSKRELIHLRPGCRPQARKVRKCWKVIVIRVWWRVASSNLKGSKGRSRVRRISKTFRASLNKLGNWSSRRKKRRREAKKTMLTICTSKR